MIRTSPFKTPRFDLESITVSTVLLICIALGLFLLWLGARNIYRGYASKQWPTTSATVRAAKVETSRSKRSSTVYSLKLYFQYSVLGQTYETDQVAWGQVLGSSDASDAEVYRRRFPVGSQVSVSYDPKEPGVAVHRPGFTSDSLWLPGAALAFILVGVMFTILYRNFETDSGLGAGMTLFGSIFVLIGVAMLSGGVYRLWLAHSSEAWPTAPGRIVFGQKSLEANQSEEAPVVDPELTESPSPTELVYRYDVAGRTRFNNTRMFGSLADSSDPEWSEKIMKNYPLGQAVQVHYDPADPDTSVLEPGVRNEAFWLPGAGMAFLLFGLAVFIFAIPALTGR